MSAALGVRGLARPYRDDPPTVRALARASIVAEVAEVAALTLAPADGGDVGAARHAVVR